MKNKHLVYAEDVVWEIMQYPSHHINKGLVKELVKKVIEEREVTVEDILKMVDRK